MKNTISFQRYAELALQAVRNNNLYHTLEFEENITTSLEVTLHHAIKRTTETKKGHRANSEENPLKALHATSMLIALYISKLEVEESELGSVLERIGGYFRTGLIRRIEFVRYDELASMSIEDKLAMAMYSIQGDEAYEGFDLTDILPFILNELKSEYKDVYNERMEGKFSGYALLHGYLSEGGTTFNTTSEGEERLRRLAKSFLTTDTLSDFFHTSITLLNTAMAHNKDLTTKMNTAIKNLAHLNSTPRSDYLHRAEEQFFDSKLKLAILHSNMGSIGDIEGIILEGILIKLAVGFNAFKGDCAYRNAILIGSLEAAIGNADKNKPNLKVVYAQAFNNNVPDNTEALINLLAAYVDNIDETLQSVSL